MISYEGARSIKTTWTSTHTNLAIGQLHSSACTLRRGVQICTIVRTIRIWKQSTAERLQGQFKNVTSGILANQKNLGCCCCFFTTNATNLSSSSSLLVQGESLCRLRLRLLKYAAACTRLQNHYCNDRDGYMSERSLSTSLSSMQGNEEGSEEGGKMERKEANPRLRRLN